MLNGVLPLLLSNFSLLSLFILSARYELLGQIRFEALPAIVEELSTSSRTPLAEALHTPTNLHYLKLSRVHIPHALSGLSAPRLWTTESSALGA